MFLISPNCFCQNYKIAKLPDWVKVIEPPKKSLVAKYDISSGYYATLADYQINLDENAAYNHEVIKVVSHSGITKASQLLVTYDTSYQKLKIHHLYVWRNGTKIDRTSSLSFEIMNNEYDLQNGLYMGKITAYDNLNDIRKEDLIDFAYTLVGKNPIFKDGKYLFVPLEVTNPVDLYAIRVLHSKEKNYRYSCVDCDSTILFTNTIQNQYRVFEMTMKDLKATKFEENIPGWILPYKHFTLSSFKTWREINTWAQNVFKLEKEPNLESVFAEIFTGKESRDEKINKLINYVQDDIRYMGMEAGIGSIKPFAPDQVVKQRFGDCKDKSLLLVSLLKKIGIKEAYPALVNVSVSKGLDKFYASNEVFDHCIVHFVVDSVSYWIDPTITQQGGNYKNTSMGDYGLALIIGKPSDSLTKIPPLNLTAATKIKEEFKVKSFTEPSSLEIKSTRYGFAADMRRLELEQFGTSNLTKVVLEDLKLLYPSVNSTADLVIKDDPTSNVISTTYQYEIDGYWSDGDKMSDKNLQGYWIFRFEPQNIYDYFKMFSGSDRKFDYALPYPLNFNYRVIFHFPKDLFVYDKYTKYENSAFFFDEKTEQLSSNSLQITYNFSTKTPSIKAENYRSITEEKNKIIKNIPLVIYFNK